MYRLLKPLLFLLDPERSHHLVTHVFGWLMRIGWLRRWWRRRHQLVAPELRQQLLGMTLDNPVGLAAGFDKHATLYPSLAALGFSFIEVGTVTARAQPGNPRPRLFRLPRDRALINRFGFNNDGASAAAARLAATPSAVPLGINIGRSKVVSNAAAIDDYVEGLDQLWSYAAYVVVNVSSPNTPELRELQAAERLGPLLRRLHGRLDELAGAASRNAPPLLVKLAPDLDDDELPAICAVIEECGIAGIICANTTIRRDGLITPTARVARCGAGGLSGAPLGERMIQLVGRIYRLVGGRLPIIAVGGIADADTAWNAITAGASLVQVYTALIYEGPGLVRKLNRGLLDRLRERGLANLSEAVGRESRRISS